MLVFIRYTSGLGNSAIYARLRDSSGQFWNFSTLTWVTSSTADCKINMTERDDDDSVESLYTADIVVPQGGPYIQEAVLSSSGRVLGAESTELESIQNMLIRSLGLTLENHYEANISRDYLGNKTSSIMEIYDSPSNASLHDGTTGLIAKYQVTVTYINGSMSSFLTTRIA